MTGNDTTDSGLSEAQEHELHVLLHRAAGQVIVSTPTHPATGHGTVGAPDPLADRSSVSPRPAVSQIRSRRHVRMLAIAAALALVVGGGALVLTGLERGDRMTTGPADGPEGLDTQVGEGDIWRLPSEPPDGMELSDALTTSAWFSYQIAVDDPAAPTRWIAVVPAGISFENPRAEPAVTGSLSDGGTYALYRPPADSLTGATWVELTGPSNTGYVTVAALGVEEQFLVDLLTDVNERVSNLTDTDAMNAALRTLELPDGLQPAWNPDQVGFGPVDSTTPQALTLVYSTPGEERQAAVSIARTGTAPEVGALDNLVQMEPSQGSSGGPDQSVTRREDLGPGTLVVESFGEISLIMFTDDGVRITASEMSGSGSTLGLDGLLELVRGLRPMTEAEVRERIAAQGVEIVDANDRSSDRAESVSASTTAPPTVVTEGPTTTRG